MKTPTDLPAWIAASLFFVFAFAGHAGAQRTSEPSVSARLSTGVAKLGSDLRLVVEVENVDTAQIDALPEVDGLRLGPVPNPNAETFYSLLGGRATTSRKLSWSIPVQPLRKGEYTIPPIAVRVGTRTLATRELSLKVVEDLQGEELGFFEIDAPDQVFESEPFVIELRFGWDAAINPQINYANLSLPWLGELSGVTELDLPTSGGGATVTVGLNSRSEIRAEPLSPKTVGTRSFVLYRIKKRLVASRTGKLEFPTSHVEFGQSSANDIFGMRQTPTRRYFKRFPGFDVDVLKLPDEGRPLDFSGAVGRFSATANPDRRDVDAGDSIKLSVEWTGTGNLEFFEPPDPARIPGFESFRVYGKSERKTPDRRIVVYDLAPISPSVKEIPPLPLIVFDTDKKDYVTVATDPIPIRVRPLKSGSGLAAEQPAEEAPAFDIHDIQTEPLAAPPVPPPGRWIVLALLAIVPLAWLALRTAVRRRGDPDAPRERARRRARKVLQRELARSRAASEQARALQRFLAARTGEREQAWVGRDVVLWARENAAGKLAEADARDLAALFEDLDARTYAGRDEVLDGSQVTELADRVARGGL